MAVVSVASGSQTAVVNTEHSLSQVTGVGIYVLEVDTSALAAGDTLQVAVKTTCRPADDLKPAYVEELTGVQVNQNWHSVPVPLASGDQIAATILQNAGTAKAFPWNLMRM